MPGYPKFAACTARPVPTREIDCSDRNGGETLNGRRIQPTQNDSGSELIGRPCTHRMTDENATRPAAVPATLEFFALVLAVALPLSAVHAGLFSQLFGERTEAIAVHTPAPATGPTDVPLLVAQKNPDPSGAQGGGDVIVDEGALVSSGPVGENEIATTKLANGEIRVYTVREGDSLSQIAEMFDVTTNTIRWANDLDSSTRIQPGDSLVILPITGVRHLVKSGDTPSSIATKYDGDADEILSYNQLESAADLVVGETIIIPGGAVHQAPATPAPSTRSDPAVPAPSTSGGGGGFAHPVPGALRTQGIHGYNAVDLAAGHGTPIRAAAAGEVIVSKSSGWNGGYGNYIVVRHGNGSQTLYAHLSSNLVGVGAYVGQGETIGRMGSTGRSTGTHLHFEVRGARNPF